ncbi:MAG: glycosyltransferase family 1 protein, partial [Actinomycetales bacterium]
SESSDFNSSYFAKQRVPIIFDLVDAYLSPLSLSDDLARGIAKRLSGQISGGIRPFSHHVKDFCSNSNAVVCSSIEQEEIIKRYNTNTHVILDSHDEIPFIDAHTTRTPDSGQHQILWEGQPSTIKGVKNISSALLELSKTFSLNLDFVTDEKYYRLLNKYFEKNTLNLLEKDSLQIANLIKIIPWNINNLVECAKASKVAMIPIDLSVPMQRLKPENRLLIMWRLGLPCLTSPSPSYVRVASSAGVTAACNSLQEWIENFSRLLTDPEHAKKEILAGQNYISENHNQTILLNKWDLAFESVVS